MGEGVHLWSHGNGSLSGIGHPAPSQLLCAAKATTYISNQAHSHNHTSLASHQKSVIYNYSVVE